jgi:hypothetical protein
MEDAKKILIFPFVGLFFYKDEKILSLDGNIIKTYF